MADKGMRTLLEQLGGWEGFEVMNVSTEDEPQPDVLGTPARRLVIELRAKRRAPPKPPSRRAARRLPG